MARNDTRNHFTKHLQSISIVSFAPRRRQRAVLESNFLVHLPALNLKGNSKGNFNFRRRKVATRAETELARGERTKEKGKGLSGFYCYFLF